MTTNSLGSYTFISLHAGEVGEVPLDLMQISHPIQRAGVDDTAFVFVGKKGVAFHAKTIASYGSFANAVDALANYRALSAGTSVNMVWAGVDMGASYNLAYQVMKCDGNIKKMSCVIGGVPVAAGPYVLTAVWELIPVLAS